MWGVTLEHEQRKNSFEGVDFQGHESMHFAESQKAGMAGNYARGLRACVAAYLNKKMLFSLMLKKHCLF